MNHDFFFRKTVSRVLLGACLCSVLGSAGSASAATSDTSAEGLDQFAWHKRLLVVFAPDARALSLTTQRAAIARDHEAFAARDLITIEVVGDKVSGASVSARILRQHYGVPDDAFQVLLIGKDTGVKIRSGKPVAATQLTQTIDAMPMRQQETRSSAQ
jgi:hypothetical protein